MSPRRLSRSLALAAVVAIAVAAVVGLRQWVEQRPVELAVGWLTAESLRIEVLTVPEAQADEAMSELRARGAVVGRNGQVRALTDPQVKDQWGYERLGGQQLLDAGATGVGVTVAVLDTGVDSRHPELAGRVLAGYDIVRGVDMPSAYDPGGHGTHVAGIIAADARNGVGVAGLAPDVRILPVRVLDDTGYGDDAGVGRGLVWAVDHGAQVVNMSLGTYDDNPVMAAAVQYAASKGVVVVASAGNDRAGGPRSFPAAYPSTVAVAATSSVDGHSYYSTTGAYVDLAAPGDLILSTYPDGRYVTMSGTSMAAPHVTAAVAVVAARQGVSAMRAVEMLSSTAIDLGPSGKDDQFGSGLISVTEASGVGERVPPLKNPVGTIPGLPSLPSLAPMPSMPSVSAPPVPALPPMPSLAPGVPTSGNPQNPALPALPSVPAPPPASLQPGSGPVPPALPDGPSLMQPSAPSDGDPTRQPTPLPPAMSAPPAPALPELPASAAPPRASTERVAVALALRSSGSRLQARVQLAGADVSSRRVVLRTVGSPVRVLARGVTDSRGRWSVRVSMPEGTSVRASVGAWQSAIVPVPSPSTGRQR